MAIHWDAFKSSLKEGNGKGKYYARAIARPKHTFDTVMKDIERSTSATGSDVLLIVDSIASILEEALPNGESVEIEGLGSFEVKIGSKGADSYDDLDNNDIEFRGIHFTPSRKLINVILNKKIAIERKKSNRKQPVSDSTVKKAVINYLNTHDTIHRGELQECIFISRSRAVRLLKSFSEGEEAFLKNIGSWKYPIYVKK